MTTISPAVAEALASVCGFHDTDPCPHCVGAYDHRSRHWRWSDERIVADTILYRDHREVWLQQAYDAYAQRQKEQEVAR